ncbi:MAG: T9SS type A sorting domain-containing protein, partial [Bacteroidota bacterium]
AVGGQGTILKTTNGGTNSIAETKSSKSTFIIFPNPANNKITISNNRSVPEEILISILDLKGDQLVQEKFQNQIQIELDLSKIANGMYLVKIQTNHGIEIKKLVIE